MPRSNSQSPCKSRHPIGIPPASYNPVPTIQI